MLFRIISKYDDWFRGEVAIHKMCSLLLQRKVPELSWVLSDRIDVKCEILTITWFSLLLMGGVFESHEESRFDSRQARASWCLDWRSDYQTSQNFDTRAMNRYWQRHMTFASQDQDWYPAMDDVL
jgi:hypothetical protein